MSFRIALTSRVLALASTLLGTCVGQVLRAPPECRTKYCRAAVAP